MSCVKSHGIVLLAACLLISCNREKENASTNTPAAETPAYTAVALKNNLGNAKSSLLTTQSKSSIFWQNWGPHVFETAKAERKTVLALIGSGTDVNTHEIISKLSQSTATSHLLNRHHINVLIDANIDPEMQYFATQLCAQSNTTISQPILVWFSYEGNPISWSPTNLGRNTNVAELVTRMSNTVNQLWRDDPEYVLQNSRNDFARRSQNVLSSDAENTISDLKVASLTRALASLYDPTSNNIDRIGRNNSQRYVKVMAKAAVSGSLTSAQRARCGGIARLAAQKILIQGLIDPIDGGVWDGKQRTTYALPVFSKSFWAQSQALEALFSLYQQTEDDIYLVAAEKIHTFTEQNLKQSGGDYSEGIVYAPLHSDQNTCVWTLEQLEQLLTEEELRICKLAFEIRGLGNIPLVDDPDRSYFRKNSLTWRISESELQQKAQMQPDDVKKVMESAMKKLSKARNNAAPATFRENTSTLRSLSAYTSALVTAYRATGKTSYLKQAKSLFQNASNSFRDDTGKLRETKFSGKLTSEPATAGAHAALSAAALDLHDATQEASYLEQAKKIHRESMQLHYIAQDKLLLEQGFSTFPTAYQIVIEVNMPTMTVRATVAQTLSNISRILLRGEDPLLIAQQQALTNRLGKYQASSNAILLLDFIGHHAALNQPIVKISSSAAPELFKTATRRPCQIITLSDGTSTPAGSASVHFENKNIGTTSNPSELRDLIK